jgi:flagella basal body P-ring formation protein FlgA
MCYYRNVIKYHLMITTLLGSAVLIISAAENSVSISFLDSVTVNDTAVYMRDIALITSPDSRLNDRIGMTIAGESAPPGHSRFIKTNDLMMYRIKVLFKDIEFKTNKSGRILVTTAYVERKLKEFREEILEQLQTMISWKPDEWNLQIENEENTFKCFDAPLSIEFGKIANAAPRGPMQLQFMVRQYDKCIRIPLNCRISVRTPVLVSHTTLSAGQKISQPDCDLITKDITSLGPQPCYAFSDVENCKTNRTISAGSIIVKNSLKKIPDIEKGDNVFISISRGNVKISVTAIARENGSKGQKIWVQNAATNKLVRVLITDKKSAQLL